MSYSLRLVNNPAVDSTDTAGAVFLASWFTSWRHSIRFIGGCWAAEGVANLRIPGRGRGMTRRQMQDFYSSHVGKRIIAASGGHDYWDGLIARIELTTEGQTFVKSTEDLANRAKIIYTKVGANLLANGDVESAAWAAVGTPSTIVQTTTWFAKGTTGMHCVTDAGAEGMVIEDGVATSLAITAGQAYVCSVIIEVVSGNWTLSVYQDDSTTVLAQRTVTGAGKQWLQCQIPDSHAYTGDIVIHLTADAGAAECYADGAVFRTAPIRAETEWVSDASSINAFGRHERIFLEGEKTDDEADAQAARELAKWGWPKTTGPTSSGTFGAGDGGEDQLIVTCVGGVSTLAWRHSIVDAATDADAQINSLLDESEFFASGATSSVVANATEVLLESGSPRHIWRQMEKVIKVGDGSGAEHTGGGYPGFRFYYEARPTTLNYEFRGGVLYRYGGAPLTPIEIQPGFILLHDMPLTSAIAGAGTTDDPRWQLTDEVWFIDEDGIERNEWTWSER